MTIGAGTYCEEHGLSYWSMRDWIRKLAEPAVPASQRLVELEPVGDGAEHGGERAPIELAVGDRYVLRLWPHLRAERRARVEPVLDKMHSWLRQKQDQVLPGSALGKAIAFALGQWPKLIRYLDHPQLTPDNNSCEQAIRPFVGRKNWLFSGSPRGAAASALLYSLIETAKGERARTILVPARAVREAEKLPLARTRADYLALLPTARPSPPAP